MSRNCWRCKNKLNWYRKSFRNFLILPNSLKHPSTTNISPKWTWSAPLWKNLSLWSAFTPFPMIWRTAHFPIKTETSSEAKAANACARLNKNVLHKPTNTCPRFYKTTGNKTDRNNSEKKINKKSTSYQNRSSCTILSYHSLEHQVNKQKQ